MIQKLKLWLVRLYNYLSGLPSYIRELLLVAIPLIVYGWIKGQEKYDDGRFDEARKQVKDEVRKLDEERKQISSDKVSIDKQIDEINKEQLKEEKKIDEIENEKLVKRDYSDLDSIDRALDRHGL